MAQMHAAYEMLTPAVAAVMVAADGAGPTWSERFLAAHNFERAKAGGLAPLRRSAKLDEVAQLRVDDMVAEKYFGHADPNSNPGKYNEILERMGVTTFSWAGENLAMNNYPDPLAEAMRGLMGSPTHRANILFDGFDTMGAAAQIRPADAVFVFACIFTGGVQV